MARAMVLPLAVALVMMTQLGAVRGDVTDDTITITPTTLPPGATLTATIANHDSSDSVFMCFTSHTATGIGTITCPGAAGTDTASITAAGSGTARQCLPAATDGAAVSLTWTEPAQDYIRVKLCTTAASGVDNAEVALTSAPISVAVTPTTLAAGATLTATYTNWISAAGNVWLAIRSGTATGVASPACEAAGTATAITTAGSGAAVVTTASASDATAVTLTWTDKTEDFVRVRACIGTTDTGQTDNTEVALTEDDVSVAVTPTTLAAGGTLTATYSGHTTGTSLHLCFKSGTATGVTSPACAAAGEATAVTTAGSGAGVVCTAAATTGAAVSLTWTDTDQDFMRVRACITATDAAQADNAEVGLTVAPITITVEPTTLAAGDTFLGTVTNWGAGAFWMCYSSATGAGVTSPACAAAGTATTVTAAGSGASVQCTASASTGYPVQLTWTEATQVRIRVRACTSATDAAQTDNAEVTLTAGTTPILVLLTPTTIANGGTLTATYSNWATGAQYVCFRSGTTAAAGTTYLTNDLACTAAATATTVTAAGSGTATACTASATTGAAVTLTWSETTQLAIKARACIANADTTGHTMAITTLTFAPISVAVTPTTLAQGATLTATYTNWATGAAWICYSSSTTAVASSPACAAAGTATTVTAAGSGTAGACTASTTTGAAVTLTWTESAQDNVRVRACTSASDTAQANNANVALTLAAAAGNGTATTGTATTLTGVANTRVTQVVTITSVTSTEYNNATSTNMKMTYQCAYLNTISQAATPAATWCTATNGNIVWDSGIGIDSTAAANARRTGSKITFTTAIATTLATSTVISAAAVAAGTGFGAAMLVQFNAVNALTNYGITAPAAGDISADVPTYAYYDATGTITSSASAIMPSLLTGMVALSAMLAM